MVAQVKIAGALAINQTSHQHRGDHLHLSQLHPEAQLIRNKARRFAAKPQVQVQTDETRSMRCRRQLPVDLQHLLQKLLVFIRVAWHRSRLTIVRLRSTQLDVRRLELIFLSHLRMRLLGLDRRAACQHSHQPATVPRVGQPAVKVATSSDVGIPAAVSSAVCKRLYTKTVQRRELRQTAWDPATALLVALRLSHLRRRLRVDIPTMAHHRQHLEDMTVEDRRLQRTKPLAMLLRLWVWTVMARHFETSVARHHEQRSHCHLKSPQRRHTTVDLHDASLEAIRATHAMHPRTTGSHALSAPTTAILAQNDLI